MLDSGQNSLPSPMTFFFPKDRKTCRKRAAQLLEAVLDEQIEPRIAINRWPVNPGEPDASLDCAYHALWYFEADETQQQTELFYMDAQLELLRQMVRLLDRDEDFPDHIRLMYAKEQAVRFFQASSPWMEPVRLLMELRRIFQALWREVRRIVNPSRL